MSPETRIGGWVITPDGEATLGCETTVSIIDDELELAYASDGFARFCIPLSVIDALRARISSE